MADDSHSRLAVYLDVADGDILALLDHDGGAVVASMTQYKVVADGGIACRVEAYLAGSKKLFFVCPACVEAVAHVVEEVQTSGYFVVEETVALGVKLGVEPLGGCLYDAANGRGRAVVED